MLDLEKALNVHQTLQAGSAMKSIYDNMSRTLEANADDGFIDNAARIENMFGPLQAERYMVKKGLMDDPSNKPATGRRVAGK